MALARSLSASNADRLGRSLGAGAYRVLGSRRVIAADNLHRALDPAINGGEIDGIVRSVFENIGRTVIELARIDLATPQQVLRVVEPIKTDLPAKLLEQKSGALWITAHFGNWELLAYWACAAGYPLDIIMGEQHNPRINELLIELRKATGVGVISTKGALRQVLKSLHGGRWVAMAADQHAPAGNLILDFFGRKASVARGPAMFAIKADVPMVPVLLRRKSYDRHQVLFGDPVYPLKSGDIEQDVTVMTETYLRFLERMITRFPDQWAWTHRRWKVD